MVRRKNAFSDYWKNNELFLLMLNCLEWIVFLVEMFNSVEQDIMQGFGNI